MEFLKDIENFGAKYRKGDNLAEFLAKLVSFLERKVFNRISKRVNFLLKRVNDNKLEIVADGNSDKNEDDNWRFIESSGNLLVQKRISGTWTTLETYYG